ncbi:MAG TPA: hypothetical protein VH165_23645 [Kofleriaceae bacterium]|nr:hypothetical protein [Kofleriaceae bacterium]
MRRFMWVLVLAGCQNDGAAAKDPPPPPRKLAGVYPEQWKCESVATLDALGAVLGGTVKPIDSPMSVPRGVPHPCNYELALAGASSSASASASASAPASAPASTPVAGSAAGSDAADPRLEYWTFDIDCRDGMKQRADALFAQYRQTSRELVEQYAAVADAGALKTGARSGGKHARGHEPDAGVEAAPPAPATDVAVGAKGLDHHGQGLIFIDDDAPCYVRVVGKDAARRLELARMLARNLTFANAPMTPRAAP